MVLIYIRSTNWLEKKQFSNRMKKKRHTHTHTSRLKQINWQMWNKWKKETNNKKKHTRDTLFERGLAIDHRLITIRVYDWVSLFVLIAKILKRMKKKIQIETALNGPIRTMWKERDSTNGVLRAMRERRLQQRRLIATSVHWRKVYSLNNNFFSCLLLLLMKHNDRRTRFAAYGRLCLSAGASNI